MSACRRPAATGPRRECPWDGPPSKGVVIYQTLEPEISLIFDSRRSGRLASRVSSDKASSIVMRSPHRCLIVWLLATVCLVSAVCASTHPVHAPHGMVVSVHDVASQVGVEILQAGGNAVDAAVATGFALAVVHPAAGNIGGGGFMLVRTAKGDLHFLDYREKAPAAASRDMYLDAQGNVIPRASLVGYKSIGVPGSVAGLVYAEKHWGKLGLHAVMQPAIRLARQGVHLTWEEAQSMHEDELANFPDSKRIFQRNG